MAAHRTREGHSRIHPLESTFQQLALAGMRVPHLGRPKDPTWVEARLLCAPGNTRVHSLVARYAEIRKTDDFLGVAAHFTHIYPRWLVRVGIGGFVLGRRVPDLSAVNTSTMFKDSGKPSKKGAIHRLRFGLLPDDPASAHPDAVVLQDEDALRQWMFARLIDDHLEPLFRELRHGIRISYNVLWGNLAAACAEAVCRLNHRGLSLSLAQKEVGALLDALKPRLGDRASVYSLEQGGLEALFARRRSCCLKYRLGGKSKCKNCGLRTDNEIVGAHLKKLRKLKSRRKSA